MKSQLEDSWGITDRQTAIETLLWLAEQGHVSDYQHTMQMMGIIGLLDCTDEQFEMGLTKIAEEEQVEDIQAAIEYYGHMREINSVCQDNGIDAWDYCRIMQISGNSYYCGYLTLEECLSIQLATSLAIQDQFDSWQELNDSYYYGYSYWAYGSYAVGYRKMMYNDLAAREDSPWKVLDFNMPLEKFW